MLYISQMLYVGALTFYGGPTMNNLHANVTEIENN
jgi:hypothetical protein